MLNSIKAAVVIISVVSFLALTAYGQDSKWTGFVEAQGTTTSSGEVKPQLNVSIEHPLKGKWGMFCWILTSKGYSEAYCGVSHSPKSWITVAAGVGAETPGKPRIGVTVWTGGKVKKTSVSNFLALEALGSGFWYKETFNVSVTKQVKVGVVAQRFKGIGPHVEYNIPNTKLTVLGTVFLGNHKPIAQFVLRYKF